MSLIHRDRILCFGCAELVEPFACDGVEKVRCIVCDHVEALDKAMDECFVYMVASAASVIVASSMRRSYRFMPVETHREDAMRGRAFMIETGRALRLAA